MAKLLRDHWAWSLEQSPIWATRLGVHRFDDRIGDLSHEAVVARREASRSFLRRAREVAASRLSAADATTVALLITDLEAAQATDVCEFHLWNLSARNNPVVRYGSLPDAHRVETPADGRRLLARYRQIPERIDAEIANLRRGLSRGLAPNRKSTEIVIELVRRQLDKPTAEWSLSKPVRQAHPDWPSSELERQRDELRRILDAQIRPATERYLAALEKEVRPRARGPKQVGLRALPNGSACYAATVLEHVTLPKPAEALHDMGLEEVARVDAEMLELGRRLFGLEDLAAVQAKLRDDPALYFGSEDEIVKKAEAALAKAQAGVGDAFGLKPRAECVVQRIPDYEAPFTTIAYYRQPSPDGKKPGEYFVNVHEPQTRPRFEAEVLAFHEAVPGHHTQIAIAQELGEVPAFRKHGIVNAFVEGWALYTERLSDELGLYSGDLDRMGMLSFDAWRATRLVVDTGIHHMGWTRARAESYMLAHSALSPSNIENEVDRYISWPGQALSYKSGQLEILAMRAEAEKRLGERFSLAGFHDALLGRGPVPLAVLRGQVEMWMSSVEAQP